MRTLRLDLQYDGTDFHGFAAQSGPRSVQSEVERALATILSEEIDVVPAARTDAGVHACGQVVSFVCQSSLSCESLHHALAASLPGDMSVTSLREVPAGFDAQRQAISRSYRYTIWRGRWSNVFVRRYAYYLFGPLDVGAMSEAAVLLEGTHDFAALVTAWSKDGRPGRSTVRRVKQARWSADGSMLHFDITANGFLRRMVRCCVGSLIQVGRGQRSIGEFAQMLEKTDRRLAGPNVPAHGLCLASIQYEADAMGGTTSIESIQSLMSSRGMAC